MRSIRNVYWARWCLRCTDYILVKLAKLRSSVFLPAVLKSTSTVVEPRSSLTFSTVPSPKRRCITRSPGCSFTSCAAGVAGVERDSDSGGLKRSAGCVPTDVRVTGCNGVTRDPEGAAKREPPPWPPQRLPLPLPLPRPDDAPMAGAPVRTR